MTQELKEKVKEQATAKKISPKDYFRSNEFLNKLSEAAGSQQLAKSIIASYLSSFLANPKLQETTIQSQIICLIKIASLKLVPNTPLGHAFIVPYKNTATYQIGYQGLVELCRRAGVKVFAQEVYEGDDFEFYIENGEKAIKHKLTQQGKIVKIYAGWRKGEFYDVVVWDIGKIIKHAQRYSKSFDNPDGAWHNTTDKNICPINLWMAKKTVLIDALKLAPKTAELAEVIETEIKEDLKNTTNNNIEVEIYNLEEGNNED